MLSEYQIREILATEMNALRKPDQKPITAAMFKDEVYRPYINAMQRACQVTLSDAGLVGANLGNCATT